MKIFLLLSLILIYHLNLAINILEILGSVMKAIGRHKKLYCHISPKSMHVGEVH